MLVQLQEEKNPPKFVAPLSLATIQAQEATIQAGISLESIEKEPQFEEGNLVQTIERLRYWNN